MDKQKEDVLEHVNQKNRMDEHIKLGYMYSKGEGVKQDHGKALEHYKIAIEQEIESKKH